MFIANLKLNVLPTNRLNRIPEIQEKNEDNRSEEKIEFQNKEMSKQQELLKEKRAVGAIQLGVNGQY